MCTQSKSVSEFNCVKILMMLKRRVLIFQLLLSRVSTLFQGGDPAPQPALLSTVQWRIPRAVIDQNNIHSSGLIQDRVATGLVTYSTKYSFLLTQVNEETSFCPGHRTWAQ